MPQTNDHKGFRAIKPMTPTPLYFDHNATTPLRPQAEAGMIAALGGVGNPSSVHGFGRAARRLIEDAREQVAALVGVGPESVIFTSGGTEASALAIRGSRPRRVLVSAVEHASVLDADATAARIPVDADGVVDLDALEAMLAASHAPAVVCVMLANNETGVIQPVAAVAEVAARHGATVHCDAVQAAGKVPVDFAALGVDALSVSAHKLGGPAGVGALVVRSGARFRPQLRGGGQERRLRAGTENVAGIVGFGAAAAAVGDAREIAAEAARLLALRTRLETGLLAATPMAQIVAVDAGRLPNTVCIVIPGVAAETLVMALDLAGAAISAGSACSSGKVAASHVLRAMGLGDHLARQAVRISMGWTTTSAEVDRFLAVWCAVLGRMGRTAAQAPAAVGIADVNAAA